MRTEYETMLKEFLPALRASAAKMMADDYHLNQQNIADALQMTQAAVSKYLSGKYSQKVKTLEKSFDRTEVDAFVKRTIAGKGYDAQKVVCKMCSRNLSFKCGLMIK